MTWAIKPLELENFTDLHLLQNSAILPYLGMQVIRTNGLPISKVQIPFVAWLVDQFFIQVLAVVEAFVWS
jgi:hypothetical protein